MKSGKPMPIIKPNKPFSTEDEMYGKKMGQMPKKAGSHTMPNGKQMLDSQMPGRKPASKRGALMNRLKGMGK